MTVKEQIQVIEDQLIVYNRLEKEAIVQAVIVQGFSDGGNVEVRSIHATAAASCRLTILALEAEKRRLRGY